MSTHNKILFELLFCAEAWEPDARLLGNVRAKDIKPALRDAMSALAANEQLRTEVERLRAENEALRQTAREYLETLGAAMKSGKFEMGGTAEMAHFVRQAMQRLDSLVFNREGPRPAGLERLHEPHGRAS